MSRSLMLSSANSRVLVTTPCSSSTRAAPVIRLCRVLQARTRADSPAVPCSHGLRGRLQVVCMAHPRRVARVASQIQREIGDMFVSDPVIQSAICPERRLGDDTLSAVASITNTYVSNDLQVVKVFVSVYSDDYGKRTAMLNLQRLEPYVRRLVGQRMRLRLTPEVRFVYDDSEEEADLVARVIGRDEVERYRSELEAEMSAGTSGRQESDKQGADAGDVQGQENNEDEDGDDEEDEEEEDEYEDEDEWYEDPDEQPQALPNPFGDLFVGEGPDLVQSRDGARPQAYYKRRSQGRRSRD